MALKRKSAYMEGLLEQQRRLKLEAKLKEEDQGNMNESSLDNPALENQHSSTPSNPLELTYDEKRRLKKTTCYFSGLQLSKFDEIADGIKKKRGKKVSLPDIARFLIETCNSEDVIDRMTVRR